MSRKSVNMNREVSVQTVIKKRVNKQGYRHWSGKWVKSYKRTVRSYGSHYFTTIKDPNTGEMRYAEVRVENGKRYYRWVDDKRHTRPKRALSTYSRFDQLRSLSEIELLQLTKDYNIKIDSNDTKSQIFDKLLDRAEILRYRKKMKQYSKQELQDFLIFFKIERPEQYDTKEKIIKYLETKIDATKIDAPYKTKEWESYKKRVFELTNNQKFVLRLLSLETAPGYHTTYDKEYLIKLIGDQEIRDLESRSLIEYRGGGSGGNKPYNITEIGLNSYRCDRNAFSNLKEPDYASMIKTLPAEIMNSTKELAKSEREYTIGIDFERELKMPQEIVALQGADTFTWRLKDIEFYGHTHPYEEKPGPSKNDLINMIFGRPEFIVAGNTGKTIILNIEDDNKYQKWKRDPESMTYFMFDIDQDKDREGLFNSTGVRAYPYEKGMKLKLIDDPKFEKPFPKFENWQLSKIKQGTNPHLKEEKTKEAIKWKRKLLSTKQITPEEQLNESQWMLKYLYDWQKEDTMDKYVLEKEIEKEVANYQEIVRKIEANPSEIKSSTKFSSKDQTVRWLSLSGEQLKKELNDISKYPNVESLKEASESLLSNQEKKLKTRKRLVEIIEKKIAEDRAISHLGR